MKSLFLHLAALLALCGSLHAHGRMIMGPNGGRLIAIDSATTPNAEIKVSANRKFEITFLDKNRKPLPLGERKLVVTAGDRSAAKKLSVETKGDTFITESAPDGIDYFVIMQLREPGAAKALPFRLHFNTETCADCEKPEWLCECGSKASGKNVAVPAELERLWAEINQHTTELHEGIAEKAYEAMDEVTEAFPVLLTALPAKTDPSKRQDVTRLVTELQAGLTGIRLAFAARTPADAVSHLEAVDKGLAALKAQYPAETANAKLED